MRISIITVVYNNKEGIEATFKSVVGQTFGNIEYIVIDGASTDGTLDIIYQYMSNISVLISEPDNGIYDAMNKGIEKATGDWVIFMNSGDTFVNDHVVSQFFSHAEIFKDVVIAYGDVNIINNKGVQYLSQQTKKIKYESICHQGQFIKLAALKKANGYNIEFKTYADFNFQLMVYLKNRSDIKYVPVCIANYNLMGVSSKPFYLFLAEYLNISRSVPLSNRIGYYLYAFQFAMKSILIKLMQKQKYDQA